MRNCILECGGDVKTLTHMYSDKDIIQRREVGACTTCGHVQIIPLYNEQEQTRINAMWHDHFISGNPEQNQRKIDVTFSRVKAYAKKGIMLDVGGGEGWGKKISDLCGMKYCVVEPMTSLHEKYKNEGIEVAADKIENISGEYDMIIFRHVLEHLLNPVKSMKKLASSLTEDGFIYVALPNFYDLSGRKGYRTNSLRPVHVSYFTMNKLLWLASRAGLSPVETGTDGELWAIFKRKQSDITLINEFNENKKRIRKEVFRNWVKDTRRIISFQRKKSRDPSNKKT